VSKQKERESENQSEEPERLKTPSWVLSDEQKNILEDNPRAQGLILDVRSHLREFRPKIYREFVKEGDLDDYLKSLVSRVLLEEDLIFKQMVDRDPWLQVEDTAPEHS
jgi:hypothetical protein